MNRLAFAAGYPSEGCVGMARERDRERGEEERGREGDKGGERERRREDTLSTKCP